MEIKIDLRPHYTFAYYSEGMEFGNKDLLYYSRKDKSLHYKTKVSFYRVEVLGENIEDAEYVYPITDDDVKVLQEIFRLVIDAQNAYFKKGGEPWFVCDGSECTVICGRRRIHFDGPSAIESINYFCDIIHRNIFIDDEQTKPDFSRLIKQLPEVKEMLIGFIESPSLEIEKKELVFYKKSKKDRVWWVDTDKIGFHLFSFDKKKVFNLFADYPHNLTKEQKELFDKENPYWKEFFSDR